MLGDVRTTLTRALAHGGELATSAEARLGPVVALADGIAQRLQSARDELAPAQAALLVEDGAADALVGRLSDEI